MTTTSPSDVALAIAPPQPIIGALIPPAANTPIFTVRDIPLPWKRPALKIVSELVQGILALELMSVLASSESIETQGQALNGARGALAAVIAMSSMMRIAYNIQAIRTHRLVTRARGNVSVTLLEEPSTFCRAYKAHPQLALFSNLIAGILIICSQALTTESPISYRATPLALISIFEFACYLFPRPLAVMADDPRRDLIHQWESSAPARGKIATALDI